MLKIIEDIKNARERKYEKKILKEIEQNVNDDVEEKKIISLENCLNEFVSTLNYKEAIEYKQNRTSKRNIILGAIAGDIIGSRWEFSCVGSDYEFDLLSKRNYFTDDTVMTIATLETVLNDDDEYAKNYKKWGKKYITTGFGIRMYDWINSDSLQPYGSYGNGSAMRISPCILGERIEKVVSNAYYSSICTHDHYEGIKGAIVTAICIWIAWNYEKKCAIKMITEYMIHMYDEKYANNFKKSSNEMSHFGSACQKTIPLAVKYVVESKNYNEFCRKVIENGGDTDTICAIGGPIAAALFGFPYLEEDIYQYLDSDFISILKKIN